MVRYGLLLVMLMATAGFRPVSQEDMAAVINLPAPDSEKAAQHAAEAFLMFKLDYPPDVEVSFRPAVRGYLSSGIPGKRPYRAVWMCGTIRVGPTINTGPWLVAFDWDRPNLVHDGGIALGGRARNVPADCAEIYRDGIRVFHQ